MTQCWCRIQVTPFIYGAVIAGAVRSVPLVEGVDFFNELNVPFAKVIPKPKMMILGFHVESNRAMRGAGVLRKGCGAGETLRCAGGP